MLLESIQIFQFMNFLPLIDLERTENKKKLTEEEETNSGLRPGIELTTFLL